MYNRYLSTSRLVNQVQNGAQALMGHLYAVQIIWKNREKPSLASSLHSQLASLISPDRRPTS